MSIEEDCYQDAVASGGDPAGVAWAEIDPTRLREKRTSVKWSRFAEDVLPMFVAEMDFTVAPEVQRTIIERVQAGDTGYIDGPGPLAGAFADFARDRWGWEIDHSFVHLATDVSCGIVEPLRYLIHGAGKVAVTTPVYPSFFEMFEELPVEVVQIPLAHSDRHPASAIPVSSHPAPSDPTPNHAASAQWIEGSPPALPSLDFAAIERVFAAGLDALVLSNPHNPHGILHSSEELTELARLAARYNVFVVSDEIHAPLTHQGQVFTPFAPLAAEAGALAITATSASKGWNIAGVKCSIMVAADERANELLKALPPETTFRSSILGLHANVAAFRDARDWLDRTVAQVEANFRLLEALVAAMLPGVRIAPARAGYLAWLDFREAGFGEDPAGLILREAKVALNSGLAFGDGGAGHARINLACAPDTIVQAVERISTILPGRRA